MSSMLGDCKICNKELTWNTLDNHQGVCGRCYKKSKTSKKEKKIKKKSELRQNKQIERMA